MEDNPIVRKFEVLKELGELKIGSIVAPFLFKNAPSEEEIAQHVASGALREVTEEVAGTEGTAADQSDASAQPTAEDRAKAAEEAAAAAPATVEAPAVPADTSPVHNGQVIVRSAPRVVEGKEWISVTLANGVTLDLTQEEYDAAVERGKQA